MYALFAGNGNDPEFGLCGGIDDLYAVVDDLDVAQGRFATEAQNDSGLDWAHIVDLSLPGLPKVAEWVDNGPWQIFDEPVAPQRLSGLEAGPESGPDA